MIVKSIAYMKDGVSTIPVDKDFARMAFFRRELTTAKPHAVAKVIKEPAKAVRRFLAGCLIYGIFSWEAWEEFTGEERIIIYPFYERAIELGYSSREIEECFNNLEKFMEENPYYMFKPSKWLTK